MENADKHIPCIGCGALVPNTKAEPSYHKGASPGCWEKYLEFLVHENQKYGYPDVHRITTDCYSVQHPYRHPKTIRSLNVHLISLCCIVERKYELTRATKVMAGITNSFKEQFTWLTPPVSMSKITIVDIVETKNLDEYTKQAYKWADYLWNSWGIHHETIRGYVNKLEKYRR